MKKIEEARAKKSARGLFSFLMRVCTRARLRVSVHERVRARKSESGPAATTTAAAAAVVRNHPPL